MTRLFRVLFLIVCLMLLIAADSGYYNLFNARPRWDQFDLADFTTNSSTARVISVTNLYADLSIVDTTNVFGTTTDYQRLTNFNADVSHAFMFGISATNGLATNTLAGYYYIAWTACFFGPASGVEWESSVFTNDVETDIEWKRTTSVQERGSAMASGILYLPANTVIDARVKGDGNNDMSVIAAHLVMYRLQH